MIVVTGGAGLIGSAIVWRLNQMGITNILIVDNLGSTEKWKNLVALQFDNYLGRDEFITQLEAGNLGEVDSIFHLGACSATTETDSNYLMENNYRYTLRIAQYVEKNPACKMIYASSAATYGDGENGYIDDESQLENLRPLNMYGYSKHLFDLKAKREGWLDSIVGIKYFNVYGPNEDHKGAMRSVINKAFPELYEKGTMSLFESHRPEYGDGEQLRDFVYVKDAVEMTLFFWKNREIGGIYNIGTGNARTWNDVSKSMFAATGQEPNISYIPMPEHLKGKYQYYTCADLTKLRSVGCDWQSRTLEEAIDDYINGYLIPGKHLGDEK